MHEKLKLAINGLVTITESECDQLLSFFEYIILKKNEDLDERIKNVDSFVFVEEGLLQQSIFDENGTEFICCFHQTNDFFTRVVSKNSRQFQNKKIRSVGTTSIYTISKIKLEQLSKKIKGLHELLLKTAQNSALLMEIRVNNLMAESADSRYILIQSNYPDLIDKINKQQMASFLGISPQHFSRLIKAR
jgi:hypothetical protein